MIIDKILLKNQYVCGYNFGGNIEDRMEIYWVFKMISSKLPSTHTFDFPPPVPPPVASTCTLLKIYSFSAPIHFGESSCV